MLLLNYVVSLLRLHLLPHSVAQRRLVDRFVSSQRHFVFVAHAHQQEAALRAVHSHLPDNLIEGLAVELLSNGTNAGFFGLPIGQYAIKVLDKLEHVLPGRGLM